MHYTFDPFWDSLKKKGITKYQLIHKYKSNRVERLIITCVPLEHKLNKNCMEMTFGPMDQKSFFIMCRDTVELAKRAK